MKRFILCAALVTIGMVPTRGASAQIDNVEDLLAAGTADANLLVGAYLEPFGKGFGADLNNGWFSTARPHSKLGFDITVIGSAAIAPSSDETFDVRDLGLTVIELDNPAGETLSPTVVGPDRPGPLVTIALDNPVTGQEEIIDQFNLPEGLDFNFVPAPMIQGSVGTIADTDVILRLIPKTAISDDFGSVSMFGLGVKHGLNQWIPGGGLLVVDLSVQLGFTTLKTSANLEVEPDFGAVQTGGTYDDQEIFLEAQSFTVNVLASRKLMFFTLFAGLGLETASVDLGMDGTYPVTVIETNQASPNYGQRVIRDLDDPVSLSYDGVNTARLTIGGRFGLGFLAVHAAYTAATYPSVTAGVGLSFR